MKGAGLSHRVQTHIAPKNELPDTDFGVKEVDFVSIDGRERSRVWRRVIVPALDFPNFDFTRMTIFSCIPAFPHSRAPCCPTRDVRRGLLAWYRFLAATFVACCMIAACPPIQCWSPVRLFLGRRRAREEQRRGHPF